MQLTDLQSRVRYYLGEISTTNYSWDDVTKSLNDYQNRANATAIIHSGQWEVSGEISTTDLVSGQLDYQFPMDLVALTRIEVNVGNASTGWQVARVTDMRSRGLALSNDATVSVNNAEIELYDYGFRFINAPLTTVTGGIKIFYSADATALSASTDEPKLPDPLQPYMIYGACLDYVLARGLDDYSKFQNLVDRFEAKIKEYYTNRLPMVRARISPSVVNYE